MPDVDFSLGQGDDQVHWTFPIFDPFGNPIDPVGGSVVFHLRIDDASAVAYERAGTIVPVTGFPSQVRHTFLATDTANAGVYNVTAIVTLASGEKVTFPAGDRYLNVEIKAKP